MEGAVFQTGCSACCCGKEVSSDDNQPNHAKQCQCIASPRKNTLALSYYIVGASIARPRVPYPHPPKNPPPHRWRACHAGPYKQKGSPAQTHPKPFLLYSRGEHCSPAFAERWLLRFAPQPTPNTPPLPNPQPRKYTPAPLAGLPCRPLQAKGKIFIKIISLVFNFIVGASIVRPLKSCDTARPLGWSRAPPLP